MDPFSRDENTTQIPFGGGEKPGCDWMFVVGFSRATAGINRSMTGSDGIRRGFDPSIRFHAALGIK